MLGKLKTPLLILIAVMCITVGAASALSNGDTIYKGVRIAGIDVGGMTVDQAKNTIQPKAASMLAKKITLNCNETETTASIAELGAKVDIEKPVQEAYKIGREGNILKRIVDVMMLWKEPVDIGLDYAFNKDQTIKYLTALALKVDSAPRDASIKISGGTIHIIPDKTGVRLDVQKSAERILAALDEGAKQISLVTVTAQPSVKADELKKINGMLASYSTRFKPSQKDRSYNLKLACKAIDGHVLKPGEVFSYNKVVGPREKKYGFRDAPIFVNGGVEDGTGGGICQVSTTLYNAALLSNLKIVRRAPHSRPVAYAPIGRDATVAYPSIDLRFQNTTKAPIYISARIVGNTVNVSLYGMKTPGISVSLESDGHQVIKPGEKRMPVSNLPPGKTTVKEPGRAGHKISIYRIVKQNGKILRRELVSNTYYRPEDRVILVGKPLTPQKNEQQKGSPVSNGAA